MFTGKFIAAFKVSVANGTQHLFRCVPSVGQLPPRSQCWKASALRADGWGFLALLWVQLTLPLFFQTLRAQTPLTQLTVSQRPKERGGKVEDCSERNTFTFSRESGRMEEQRCRTLEDRVLVGIGGARSNHCLPCLILMNVMLAVAYFSWVYI